VAPAVDPCRLMARDTIRVAHVLIRRSLACPAIPRRPHR
jgi:hypothetical protein